MVRASASTTAMTFGSTVIAAASLVVAAQATAYAAGFDHACLVSFNMDQFSLTPVGRLAFTVSYPPAVVHFADATGTVSCQSLVETATSSAFSADDTLGRLTAEIVSTTGFATVAGIATCDALAVGVPTSSTVAVAVDEELDTGGRPLFPQVPVGLLAIDCTPIPPSTTLPPATTTTTTTTLPAALCGRPLSGAERPVASDCLFILRAAVGSETCSPECVCRPSGAAQTTATDALICLIVSVGGQATLDCPC